MSMDHETAAKAQPNASAGAGEPDNMDNMDKTDKAEERGLPLWLPMLALIGALVFGALALTRVCPALSGLVFPPDPPLPSGDVRELQPKENKGAGRDEWLYGTNMNACEVMRFYADRIGGCQLDPSINCEVGAGVVPDLPGVALPVAVCQAKQQIGIMQITWTVRIATNYAEGGVTHFRVTREVTN